MRKSEKSETMTVEGIYDFVTSALVANGLSRDQSKAIADIVTRAEAGSCRSHGLYRIEGYVAGLPSGRVNPVAQPQVRRVKPAMLVVDGDNGFAPFAADLGRPQLIPAARENGIAAMAISNTHHFSALWADLEPLGDAGLVAWCFVVGQCAVAPYGGTTRLMGTNPIGFARPRPGSKPFIFDFATSAAARGEVELKRLSGEPIPEGWGIDATGQPTTDPTEALSGALLPFGGHKGSALSMMVELIAGPLIGELTSKQVAALGHQDNGPPSGGELFIVLDPFAVSPTALAAGEGFFADALSQPGLRLPSERRYTARAESTRTGVSVPVDLLDQIRSLIHS